MEPSRFDTLTRSLRRTPSRRAALHSTLGGLVMAAAAWLGAPTALVHAGKQDKKDDDAAKPYCFGALNICIEHDDDELCHRAGTSPLCQCYSRADVAKPYCGVYAADVANCSACTAGQVCVVAGYACPTPFTCVTPCPHPR